MFIINYHLTSERRNLRPIQIFPYHSIFREQRKSLLIVSLFVTGGKIIIRRTMEAEDDGRVISANGSAEDSRIRIYVGGLGGSVTEFDLKKTFSSTQMGLVDSVEVVRSKGRSFAYLDFVPFSDKGLSTLFSKYNGCTWKGGKLRLEKAKEHYSVRLRREWAEDTAICRNSEVHNDNNNEEHSMPKKLMKTSDMENICLQLFFPRLKKIKQIPFKGTGKHKYSFQHIAVPALPSHFCDCEEHSSSPSKLVCQKASSTYAYDKEGVVGMNKEELDTMNSVLSKILAREHIQADVSMVESYNLTDSTDDPHAGADRGSDDDGDLVMNLVAAGGNDVHVGDTGEDRGSDEDDNLIINIVAGGNSKKSFSDIRDKYANTAAANKGLKGSENNGPDKNVLNSNKKKRKAPLQENGDGNSLSNKLKILPHPPHAKLQLEDHYAERSTKIPWSNLKSGNATFRISDIAAQNNTHGADVQGKPDNMNMENKKIKSSKETEEKQKSDDVVVPGGNPEVVVAENKVKRNLWVQKSSWMQLLGEPSKSTFCISQVLSGSAGGLNMENQDQEQLLQMKKSNESSTVNDEDEHQKSGKGYISDLQQEDVNVSLGHTQSIINNNSDQHLSGDQLLSVKPSLQDGNNYIDTNDASPTTALATKRNPSKLQQVDPYSFVRSAASMKEWKKAKEALSRAGRNRKST